jgi:hypothetical protein
MRKRRRKMMKRGYTVYTLISIIAQEGVAHQRPLLVWPPGLMMMNDE